MFTSFSEVFLTDNGPEFDSLIDLSEEYPDMHVFYCHPLSSFEKGACERNHELVRFIHYKGWSFDSYTQEDIDLMFSHINSYPRKSLNKKNSFPMCRRRFTLRKRVFRPYKHQKGRL